MMVKSGLDFFYFEILRVPSEIAANLPGQFTHSGQMFLHWAAAFLKGHVGFQKKYNTTISPSSLSQKYLFQELRIYFPYSSCSRWCELVQRQVDLVINLLIIMKKGSTLSVLRIGFPRRSSTYFSCLENV